MVIVVIETNEKVLERLFVNIAGGYIGPVLGYKKQFKVEEVVGRCPLDPTS